MRKTDYWKKLESVSKPSLMPWVMWSSGDTYSIKSFTNPNISGYFNAINRKEVKKTKIGGKREHKLGLLQLYRKL